MRPVYAARQDRRHDRRGGDARRASRRSLGVEWGPVRNGIAELAGVPDRRCASTSPPATPRSCEEAVARGYSSSRAGIAAIQRETRDRKRRHRARAGRRRVARPRGRARLRRRELAALVGRVAASATSDYNESARRRRSSCSDRRGPDPPQLHLHPARGDPGGSPTSTPRARRPATSSALPTTSSRRVCVALTRGSADTERGHQDALYTTPDMLRAEVRLSRRPPAAIRTAPLVGRRPSARGGDRRASDARRRPGGRGAPPLLGRGAGAGDGGARRHRQDLHPRGGARGLRALGCAGDRRRLAGPGGRRPPARGRHPVADGRAPPRRIAQGRGRGHPRRRGDRGATRPR